MNVFDKVVETISPVNALKREMARQKLDLIQEVKNSGYSESGASTKKKSLKGWNYKSRSPDKDIHDNLSILRQRSRSLYMGAPLATSAIKNNRTNVIGSGLKLKPSIDFEKLGIKEEDAKKWERNTEREFNLWAESKHCDATRLNNFYELQSIMLMGWLLNGDSFCLPKLDKIKPYMPYRLRLMLIEADRIRSPVNKVYSSSFYKASKTTTVADNGNIIFDGVEVDSFGTAIAYYIFNSYPGESNVTNNYVRLEACGEKTGVQKILHLMETERAEQYRGTPYLAPVIEELKNMTRYEEASIISAIVQSFFTAFIKHDDNKAEIPFNDLYEEEEQVDKEDSNSYELGAGSINVLGENEDVVFANPTHPVSGFDAFMGTISKYVGAALEIPYEILTKHFNSSYSASRAALLEAWKAFKMRRVWFANDFCQPVYELWLSEAIAIGRIKAPGFFLDPVIKKAWTKAEWIGPSQGMLDPVKEVKASELLVSNGYSTREHETIKLVGGDWNSNIRKVQKENEIMSGGQSDNEQILGNKEHN